MNALICPRCGESKKPTELMCTICTFMEFEPKKRQRIGDPIEPVQTTESFENEPWIAPVL